MAKANQVVETTGETVQDVRVAYNEKKIEAIAVWATAELEAAQKFAIANDEDEAFFVVQLREVRKHSDELEAMKQTVLAPLNVAVKAFRAIFKPREDKLAALDTYLNKQIGAYRLKKSEEQRKQLLAAKAAAETGNTPAVTKALVARDAAASQKLEGASVVIKWVAFIDDADAVPRDWCTPDEKRIRAHASSFAANATPTPIKGVRFEKEASTRIRR